MTDLPTFEMQRSLDAPRALVWRTWTEADLLARWYGPGVETVIHELDVRTGGLWLNEMRMSKGSFFQKAQFSEVVAAERLVFTQANTDADWNPAANPMMPDWPQVMLTTVTLTEAAGRTNMRLEWTPHEATEAEIACFSSAMAGLDKGWGAGFDLLAELVVELRG